MKVLITITTLIILSFAALANYHDGAVKYQACGQNTQPSTSHSTRFGYIKIVFKVCVHGFNVKTPRYTVDFVSNRGERTTYVYTQTNNRPLGIVPPMPSTHFKPAVIEMKIIGTVERGSFTASIS